MKIKEKENETKEIEIARIAKESKKEEAKLKPVENIIEYTIIFKEKAEGEEEIKEISYLLTFVESEGVLEVAKQNKFGTKILIGRFTNKNGTKITFKKMLETFEEMSTISYEKFKETFENRKKKSK